MELIIPPLPDAFMEAVTGYEKSRAAGNAAEAATRSVAWFPRLAGILGRRDSNRQGKVLGTGCSVGYT
jgi:hypothetical protein